MLLSDPTLPGTFINEQRVAEEVGISRTPVREALLLLSAEGLVQLVPNRGAFVPPLTPDQVHHILSARTVIESWATEEAMRHGAPPVARMRECMDRQRALLEGGTFAEFIAADREFHTELLLAAGNPVMSQMYETLRARHVIIGVAALERDRGRREQVLVEHAAIISALESGDVDQAITAVVAHLRATTTMLARS